MLKYQCNKDELEFELLCGKKGILVGVNPNCGFGLEIDLAAAVLLSLGLAVPTGQRTPFCPLLYCSYIKVASSYLLDCLTSLSDPV